MLQDKKRIRTSLDLTRWRRDLLAAGLVEIPLNGLVAIHAARLAAFHKDPADCMVLASAIEEAAELCTADEKLLEWKGKLRRFHASL